MNRWPTKLLEDIADLTGGSTPSREDSSYWGGEIPWVTPTDLPSPDEGISVVSKTRDRLTHIGLDNCSATVIPKGAVLFSSRATIGKVAIAGVPVTTNQGFINLVPKPGVNSHFLAYVLWNQREQIARLAGSTTFKEVSRRSIRKFPIPVPPLAEQVRIVKLLDEVDELRKLRAQADRRTAALIPALFHEMFGRRISSPAVMTSFEGFKAPEGWRWAPLLQVAKLATGHTPSRKVREYWNGNIPWISLSDIRAVDGLVAYKTSENVTKKGIANSSSVILPKGTVCFSRTASVGFVTVMGRDMATSQDFVNWTCGEELDPIFLMCAFMHARKHLRSLASGSTHKTIYFPTVKQFCTIVPPIQLQRKFAVCVAEVREMEAEQASSHRCTDALFQSLLHRAFQGEL